MCRGCFLLCRVQLQLLTRLFGFDKGVQMLVPLLDLANHQNGCTHSHHPGPCDPALDENNRQHWDSNAQPPALAKSAGSGRFGPNGSAQGDSSSRMSGQCVVWRATEYVAAGQEVCNAYKILTQDRALLQYGFLQVSPVHRQCFPLFSVKLFLAGVLLVHLMQCMCSMPAALCGCHSPVPRPTVVVGYNQVVRFTTLLSSGRIDACVPGQACCAAVCWSHMQQQSLRPLR